MRTPFGADAPPQWYSLDITSTTQAVGTRSGVAVLLADGPDATTAALLHIPNSLTGEVSLDEPGVTPGVEVLATAVPAGVEYQLSASGDGQTVVVASMNSTSVTRAKVTVQAYDVKTGVAAWASPLSVGPNDVPLSLDASTGLIRVRGHALTLDGEDITPAAVSVDLDTHDLPVSSSRLLRRDGLRFNFEVLRVPTEERAWEAEQVQVPAACGLRSGARLLDVRAGVVLVRCGNYTGTVLAFDGQDGNALATPKKTKRPQIGLGALPSVDAQVSPTHAVIEVDGSLLGLQESGGSPTRLLWVEHNPAAGLDSSALSGPLLFTTAGVVEMSDGSERLAAEGVAYDEPLVASVDGGSVVFASAEGAVAYDPLDLPQP